MNSDVPDKRLRDLLRVLGRLTEQHLELRTAIEGKVERMRSGHVDGLQNATRHERALIESIAEQEGLRRQLMDAIGRGFGISPQAARGLSARQLAERLAGPPRIRLLEAAGRLKTAAAAVSEVNQIATLIAQQVLHHLRCVFQAVATCDQPPDTYTPRGTLQLVPTRRLFEMTG